jgi:thymidylate synthase
MYIAVASQPDCATAWREALRTVIDHGLEAHNVILDIADPTAGATMADPVVRAVDDFLRSKDVKPVETVANTLFPAALSRQFKGGDLYEAFMTKVLPAASKGSRWSGYYFERMINLRASDGTVVNQIADIIDRISDPKVTARNKYEIQTFDPTRDVTRVNFGGQCLSHGSFKLRKDGAAEKLDLTVLYRNHFYVEKLLGNLIGLGRLMAFVAQQSGVEVGALTVISTHACADQPKDAQKKQTSVAEVKALLAACDALVTG